MVKSESIDALLTPALRVSRPVAACSRCRGAKIKCDGRLPACTACERAGKASPCSGANDEFAKGKERSYVAALEAAADRLQRKIEAASKDSKSIKSPVQTVDVGQHQTTHDQVLSPAKPGSAGRARRKEASDVDDLVGDFGFLSVNATSRDFHGFTSNMSFARLLLSASVAQSLPETSSSPLPPRHVATRLIQDYLDNVFVLLPFFSEIQLMGSVSAVYENPRQARATDLWMVHMILSISNGGAASSKDDFHDQRSLQHAAIAMQYVEAVLHPGAISGIQALLLLVQFAVLQPGYFKSWDLIGMAARITVDLGLHVEPSNDSRPDKESLNMRRRVFYCVFALDRSISMAYDRAFSFSDDSAAVLLPTFSNEQKASQWIFGRSLRLSLYLFDIRRVQSAFYQISHCSSRSQWDSDTATGFTSSILKDIQSWYSTIPSSINQRHAVFFQVESLYSQITALAPSERIARPALTEFSKTLIFEGAIQYSSQMQLHVLSSSSRPLLTYVDFLRTDKIGRLFREVMWSSFDHLLNGGEPHSSELSPSGNVSQSTPSLSRSTFPSENCHRAIACLNNILSVLDYARQRWGLDDLKGKFEKETAVLLGKLNMKQQELSSPQYYADIPTQQQFSPEYPLEHVDAGGWTDTRIPQQSVLQRSRSNEVPQQHQLFRTTSLELPNTGSGMYGLPQGSLPRRGYEFHGGANP